MKEKDIILTARIMSMVFMPFYLPIVGLVALFVFSYMNMLDLGYKLTVLLMAYLFTILLPTLLIHYYRKHQGWTLFDLSVKERRLIPYLISILCYFTCYYLMTLIGIPQFMSLILMAALTIQVVCAIINIWWKISTHNAAIGGVAGALLAYSLLFQFDPQGWLCLVLIIAGLLGTSRMILRQHTLGQVIAGFMVGLICGFVVIV